jgi:multiple sugar transport system substrate-binding protein
MYWKNIQLTIRFFILSTLTVTISNCANTLNNQTPTTTANHKPETLSIWWTKGYYPEEDEAIQKIVANWEKQAKAKGLPIHQADLQILSDDENMKLTQERVEANQPPDIVFNRRVEFVISPAYAWQGKLADVSSVIEPIKNNYSAAAIASVNLYNNTKKTRAFYAVPIQQQTLHIHYWRDLLEEAGFRESDIPQDWDGFWQFWQTAQARLRAKGNQDIYGVGLTMSSEGNDTIYQFEQALIANNIKIFDDQGNLQIDQPTVQQGITKTLQWFTDFYKNGYVPADAIDWTSEDNNVKFLNKQLLMVVNPTLSIPVSQKADQEVYEKQIGTINFPKKPDGKIMPYLVSIKQIVSFTNSPHPEIAKDFLSYFVQPANIGAYIELSGGRYFPVMPELLSQPLWQDSQDPHIRQAVKQFTLSPTLPLPTITQQNYAKVFSKNVWGQAMEKILVNKLPVEQASQQAIADIKQLLSQTEEPPSQ